MRCPVLKRRVVHHVTGCDQRIHHALHISLSFLASLPITASIAYHHVSSGPILFAC